MTELPVVAKLVGFGVGLVAVFGAAFGLGRAVGPVGDAPAPPATTTTVPSEHGGHR